MTIRVVTDSTADLPSHVAAAAEIVVVPCQVIFGTTAYREGVDISTSEFYERLVSAETLPTTSQPPVGDFVRTYAQLVEEGASAIVSVHLASAYSGVYSTAVMAAQEIRAIEIEVIDSGTTSLGLGLVALEAAEQCTTGRPLREVAESVRAATARIRLLALLDTLHYIRAGGRINRLVELLGTLLDIKPILEFHGGDIVPLERVRTRRRAIRRLVERVLDLGAVDRMAIAHAAAPALAEELRARLLPSAGGADILVAEAGSVLGTHVGPGAIGVACLLAE
jgi:DegV family protein with EDD domain